jgi:glycosyltransferase involved in cell wall biosynthesis
LRLCVVSPFVDRRHGTERALAELLERLARGYRCEIHLYAQRVEDLELADARAVRPPESGAIFWRKVPSVPGPYLVQFCAWLVLNRIWRFWDRHVRGVRYDLVFSPGINCLDANVIVVHAIFHRLAEIGGNSKNNGPRELHRKAYYQLLCFLERIIYGDPKVVLVAVSNHSVEQLLRYFKRANVPVIPNGVDPKAFNTAVRVGQRDVIRQRWNISDGEHVLLFIGNDWKTKGLLTLLQAAAECCDLPLRLLVVGKEDPAGWAGLISQLHLTERITFFAPVPNVLDFYAAADVYVSPSMEDSFNLPALEAMACGIPVIVSSSSGISEWVQDGVNGLVVKDPLNAGELASALRNLLLNPEMMRGIGVNAALTAAALSWDRHAEAIYSLLLSSRAPDG